MPNGRANVTRKTPGTISSIRAIQPLSRSVKESPSAMPPLLRVENVKRRFGGILALDDVSLALDEGGIAGLIGPNGAGKTTLFNVVTRLYRPDGGAVSFDGQDLLKLPAHRIVGVGIARTFQNVALFHEMSVLENVMLGGHPRFGSREEDEARDAALAALDYLGLVDLASRQAA